MGQNLIPIQPLALGTTEVRPAAPLAVPRPRLEYVKGRLLDIDASYQRPILDMGRKTIIGIVESFDWRFFVPLILAPRGERFAIIDGQHHAVAALTWAALTLGEAMLDMDFPAMIIEGDHAIEAKAFALINGQVTRVRDSQIYAARIIAEDPETLTLERILSAAGCKVARHCNTNFLKPGETLAVGALTQSLKRHGEKVLRLALLAIMAGPVKTGVVRAGTIKGYCDVLTRNPMWQDEKRLVAAMSRWDANKINKWAEGQKAAGSGTIASFVAKKFESILREEFAQAA